jgi:hypothetical protein
MLEDPDDNTGITAQRNRLVNYNKRPSDLVDISNDIEVISSDGTLDTVHSSTTTKRFKHELGNLLLRQFPSHKMTNLPLGPNAARRLEWSQMNFELFTFK